MEQFELDNEDSSTNQYSHTDRRRYAVLSYVTQ